MPDNVNIIRSTWLRSGCGDGSPVLCPGLVSGDDIDIDIVPEGEDVEGYANSLPGEGFHCVISARAQGASGVEKRANTKYIEIS